MNTNLPLSIAVWLAQDDYDHNSDVPNLISATSLIKPIKSIVLSSRCVTTDTSADIELINMSASRIGTAIHTAIEYAWSNKEKVTQTLKAIGVSQRIIDRLVINPTPTEDCTDKYPVYMEVRTTKPILGYNISGKFDFVSDGLLEDFKSTSVMTWINQTNAAKYIQQGSIYKWLNQDIITEDFMLINYIFTDWSANKAKQDKNYPQKRIYSQKYQLMDIQDTERFITDILNKITKYKDAPEESIPFCTPEELWQRPTVYKYYKNPNNKTRSTKNFEQYYEAWNRYIEDGSIGEIVTVPGEVIFCRYCDANSICKQAKQYIDEGTLIL